MADDRKTPRPLNPGGLWILNPPEPRGNTTDVRAIAPGVLPAGHSRAIPSQLLLDVPGNPSGDPILDRLLGEHVLYLRRVALASGLDVGKLGHWSSDPEIEIAGGDAAAVVPAWSLFWGTLFLDAGPYLDSGEFAGGDQWWLVSLYGAVDAFTTAADVYRFVGPERDDAARAAAASGSSSLFEALAGNRFEWVEPTPGGQPTGGNLELVPRPWYP